MTKSFEEAILLIGLGAPRTGTKWMYEYFQSHPGVLTSPLRLLHFFNEKHDEQGKLDVAAHFRMRLADIEALGDRPHLADLHRALAERVAMGGDTGLYMDHFRRRWIGQEAMVDITPRYSSLPARAFADMARAHPRVRFLFVMRDPVDWFWSIMRLHLQDDPGCDLERATRSALTHGDWRRIVGADYLQTIERLESAAPAGSIQYAFYEELFGHASMTEICAFVDVADYPADTTSIANQGPRRRLGDDLRGAILEAMQPLYEAVGEKLGRLPRAWQSERRRRRGAAEAER
jgi:hypothetical protein